MPFYKERNEEKREEFRKKLEQIPKERRVYIDESGINEYLHRQHGRASRGENLYGAVLGNRYHRENFIAAQSQHKIFAPFCYTGTCNTSLFNTWLEKICIPELKPGDVLILDNASFHKSKTTMEIIQSAGYEVLFLPPYSPDLNPIEKFWANFKRKVKEVIKAHSNLAEAIDHTFLKVCK